jgi:coiled-coil and C2 domain-containing protein 2A
MQRGITLEDIVEGELAGELLYFNLFDEITFDMNIDDREKGKRINKRIERNWLGTVSIPFSTIHERIKIDGVFSLQMPPVTLGYERDASQIENAVLIGIDTTTNNTLVHLFITLDPPLPQPSLLKLHFQSIESDLVLRYINNWKANLSLHQANTRGRLIMCTALDLDGKTTLVNRFIKPQNPPPGQFGSSVERIIRFVSRVPYLSSRILLGADGPGLWSTTRQLLEIRAGDGVEHAILLCNLLLGLNRYDLILVNLIEQSWKGIWRAQMVPEIVKLTIETCTLFWAEDTKETSHMFYSKNVSILLSNQFFFKRKSKDCQTRSKKS